MEPPQELVDAVLTAVERRELRSLRWGYVDGSLSEAEVDEIAADVTSSAGVTSIPDEFVDCLVRRSLLFEFPSEYGYRYRTRFAEGVRLLTRLKQLLPGRSWMASPDLVSDYRLDARPRRLPRREFDISNVLRALEGIGGWDDQRSRLATAFVHGRRLSGFQIRAAQAILRPTKGDSGTVLTSGTGSGKTLAFYFPVVLELSSLLLPESFWTKAVAVFPRIELLKDQFTQAHNLLSLLVPVLKDQGRRPFRLGTFYSGTPRTPSLDDVKEARWNRGEQGYLCPFLLCPGCGGALEWLDRHIKARREILTCGEGCNTEVSDSAVVLTRERARKEPPDILFTTAETLNRRLSDTANLHIFGPKSDVARRARFLLLDEIHTYGGTSGAQTALVLRRWRQAIGLNASVRYVGLSATLEDATAFFASLTGLPSPSVTEVSPFEEELESKSMEYQLVLRGDPASRTQLLSTTIQTSFLLARLLDPLRGASPSQDMYGKRVFAFTDDLDATNRLFDFLRDAEARDIFGNPDGKRIPLAALRGADQPDRQQRMQSGQDWTQLESLGRPLAQRLNVGRTSSQDRGVDPDAEIIVATAALEVGFNDPSVGAVVQHKSPHQLSTFVQRRGRAGRNPSMRPWTVTVLANHGRDRSTYQSYDQLFDPTLRPLTLPVHNRYVLRMQVTFALLDWLAVSNRDLPGWWWQPLNGPVDRDGLWREQQRRALKVLGEVLEGPGTLRQSLTDHIRRAFRLKSREEANQILWGPPRSLLLDVIPTLVRRLETDWELHPTLQGPATTDLAAKGPPHPLPDFLPGNLFSDLNLPEVNVILPPATKRHVERTESMPIAQALGRLAPGRVTRRFAHERGGLNHWIPVSLKDGEQYLPISEYAERHEIVASIPVEIEGVVTEVPCYRPWTMRMTLAPDREVRSTSNAWQQWRTQILPQGDPLTLSTAHDPRWGGLIESVDFFMHSFHAPITIRRFALEATATVKKPLPNRCEFNILTRYTDGNGVAAAVGFEQEVDGLRVVLRLPPPQKFAERASKAQSLPAWRTAYFRDLVLEDPVLSASCNWFQRDWLQQMMFAALVESAVTGAHELPVALDSLLTQGLTNALTNAARRLFAMDSDAASDDDEEPSAEAAYSSDGDRLDQRWSDLLLNPDVTDRLQTLARELYEPNPKSWERWLRERSHETLGEALLASAYRAAPAHLAEDSLLLDLDRGDPHHDAGDAVEVWLTESALGGSGAIEALAREATKVPRQLVSSLEAAVSPSEVEMTALALDRLINSIVIDQEIAEAVAHVRRQVGHDQRAKAVDSLCRLIAVRGIAVDEGFRVAINHRILRDGTSPLSDSLLQNLVHEWHAWEDRLNVAIDLPTFALVAASHAEFGPHVRRLVAGNIEGKVTATEAAGILSSLLWPRTAEVRTRALRSYGPFRLRRYTDPSLIRELLLRNEPDAVMYGSEGWELSLDDSLVETGMARLRADHIDESEFHGDLYRLLASPVDVDYLQFYPNISRVTRDDRGTVVTLVLSEVF